MGYTSDDVSPVTVGHEALGKRRLHAFKGSTGISSVCYCQGAVVSFTLNATAGHGSF